MSYPEATKKDVITVPVSFETDEQGTFGIRTHTRLKLTRVRAVVTKALAATNAGTITVKKGTTTIATITLAAESDIGTEGTATCNADFAEGEAITIVSAKTTAGGKALVMLYTEALVI